MSDGNIYNGGNNADSDMQPRSSNSQQTSETDIIVMMMMMMLHIGNLELKVVKQYLAQGTTAM